MQRCIHMFKLMKDDNNGIACGSDIHNYNTRAKSSVRLIKSHTNWGIQRSLNSALKDWNELPAELRSATNEKTFKKAYYNNFK